MQHQVSELNAVRRTFVLSAIALGGAFLTNAASARTTTIQIWKDPNCGCCMDWISHLKKNGFQATVLDQGNNVARARLRSSHRVTQLWLIIMSLKDTFPQKTSNGCSKKNHRLLG
jgi:hypothetical protein